MEITDRKGNIRELRNINRGKSNESFTNQFYQIMLFNNNFQRLLTELIFLCPRYLINDVINEQLQPKFSINKTPLYQIFKNEIFQRHLASDILNIFTPPIKVWTIFRNEIIEELLKESDQDIIKNDEYTHPYISYIKFISAPGCMFLHLLKWNSQC